MTDRKEQLIDILTQTGRMEEADEYAAPHRQQRKSGTATRSATPRA